jgi:hypothetical protein
MMAVQQQKHPLCSAFLVLAFHTAAFIVVFTNIPVFPAAARDWQFGGFLFSKARKAKRGRGKQIIIERSSATGVAKVGEIVIGVKGNRLEWTDCGRSSLEAEK